MNILLVVKAQESSAALAQWCLRLAGAKASKLWILRVSDGENVGKIEWGGERESGWWADVDAVLDQQTAVELQRAEVRTVNVSKTVLTQIAATKAGLLVLQDRLEHPDFYRNAIQSLMESAPCALMILRLGESDRGNGRVLLPCAGGPHSRRGLKLIAEGLGKDVTAFLVEADVDEVSPDVGAKRLARCLRRSGVGAEEVDTKVVVMESVTDAIREEISHGEYGMLLIGASGVGSVRRKLFGTVPGRLLQGSDGMSVGVIRGERPIGQKIRRQVERMLLLSIPQLNRDERVNLFYEIEEKSRWSFDFASLMLLATSIAALGLISNSGAVVIGAMLVAPLMTPLLGGGLALVQGNLPLWKRCQKSVGLGFIAALGVGLLLGAVARWCGYGMTDELMARGAPSVLDLGVAFISGVAASYCLARPKLSGALAGVAIAAALVPPIATVGISLAMQKFSVAQGAAMLFGTNVVAIVLGSAANFFFAGIRGKVSQSNLWARRVAILFTLFMLGLMVPLSSAVLKQVSGGDDMRNVLEKLGDSHGYTVSRVKKVPSSRPGLQILEITVDALEPVSGEMVRAFQASAQQHSKRAVRVRVITRLVHEAGVE